MGSLDAAPAQLLTLNVAPAAGQLLCGPASASPGGELTSRSSKPPAGTVLAQVCSVGKWDSRASCLELLV